MHLMSIWLLVAICLCASGAVNGFVLFFFSTENMIFSMDILMCCKSKEFQFESYKIVTNSRIFTLEQIIPFIHTM